MHIEKTDVIYTFFNLKESNLHLVTAPHSFDLCLAYVGDRTQKGEDVIRSLSKGMSHFCSVICLNLEKHFSPWAEARPLAAQLQDFVKEKSFTLGPQVQCNTATLLANPVWCGVRANNKTARCI